MIYFNIIFFIFICLILILIVAWSIKNGIGPMPSSLLARKALLDNLPDEGRGIIYELGSGWGSLAFPLAKKYPHCTIIAYENSPIPYFVSKIILLFSRHKNLRIKRQDFFKVNLQNASIIVCYLYPGAMQKLRRKFESELKKGTLVATNTFSIPQWHAQKTIEIKDLYNTKIYIFKL